MKSSQNSLWSFLQQMIRYAPKLYALDTLFWLFISVLPILPGLIIQEFFNQLTATKHLNNSLQGLILLLLAVGVARLVAIFSGRVTKTQHRFLMSGLIRHNLFQQLLAKPGAEPLNRSSHFSEPTSMGKIISYFREDGRRVEDNVVWTNELFGEITLAVVSLIILLRVNALITVLTLLPLGAIALVIQQTEKRIKKQHYKSRYATQQVTGFMGEIFGAVQSIQVAGAHRSILKQFQTLNHQRHQQMVKDEVLMTGINSLLENLTEVGTGLILLVVAIAQTENMQLLSVGDFALFIYCLGFVTDFMGSLGGFLATSKQTEVAIDRMSSLLNPPSAHLLSEPHPLYIPPIGGKNPPLPPIRQSCDRSPLQVLQIHNLTYQYPNSNNGIFNINFTLERGSFTVITGPVGVGKTTLLQVLLGLLPRQDGQITWNGETVHNPETFFAPPRSAYTPQVPHLFSHTLKENILLGDGDDYLEEAINLAVFEDDLALMPTGLETVIGTRGVRLSGGQQQRVAATRMFVRRPELIVCDDLSSALDIKTEQKLWSRLFQLQTDQNWTPTCLVVSHRPSVLQRADQVIHLGDE